MLLLHRKEYDDLRVTSKYPLIRHRQHPCKMDELCHTSQSIRSNQLESANVTGNGVAEAGGVYTELLTLARSSTNACCTPDQTPFEQNRSPSPDWIDNARDDLIGSSARTLSLKHVYISRDRWSSQIVLQQLSHILKC